MVDTRVRLVVATAACLLVGGSGAADNPRITVDDPAATAQRPLPPADCVRLTRRARIAWNMDRPADAARAVDRAAELCPEAIGVLQEVATAAPELYQAWYYLYTCHQELGHAAEAARALQQYEAARPR